MRATGIAGASGTLTFMTLRTILFTFLISVPWVAAQATPQQILESSADAVQDANDASFLVLGTTVGPDGGVMEIDVEVLVVREPFAVSAYVFAPAALADNILAFDEDTLYDYAFITNQLTLSDLDDPEALGGPFGSFEVEALTEAFDLSEALAAWSGALLGDDVDTPRGPATRLAFENPDVDADVGRVVVDIVKSDRLPYRLELFAQDGRSLAELQVADLSVNQGLTREDVLAFPEDAQVIDER